MSDQTTSNELVFGVERELAVFKGGLQQSQKIAGVQRTGVIRNAAGKLVRSVFSMRVANIISLIFRSA